MKILLHSHLFPNISNPVFGTFVSNYATALTEIGHTVKVISPVPFVPFFIKKSHRWYGFKKIPFKSRHGNLEIYHPRFFSIPGRKFFHIRGELLYYSAKKFYDSFLAKNSFDIIHAHQIIPDGVAGSILSRKYKLPLVITVHGDDLYRSIPQSFLNLQKIQKVLGSVKMVGLVSLKLKELFTSYGFNLPEDRIKVIYNGVNIPSSIPDVKWPDNQQHAIRILSVGHSIERKGFHLVMEALTTLNQKYNNIFYYIIGDGVDFDFFRAQAEFHGISDITYFLGRKKNDEVFGYLKHADIFILPSWDEAFGVVYLEAMAMKLPIIATESEGFSEVIHHGKNGYLVKSKSVEQITNVLNTLISNSELRKQVGDLGYQTIINKFSWEKNAREYEKVFDELIKKRTDKC
jgi:glycosyltransferase involved in cell wall biosynthesis